MDAETARAYMLALPHVVETLQWGESLVFWVGDKAIGGKMFAVSSLDADRGRVIAFAAGGEHAAELCELEDLFPAPYLARAGWVAARNWSALRTREWEAELTAAHARVFERLTPRTHAVLDLPAKARGEAIEERRKKLAANAAKRLKARG